MSWYPLLATWLRNRRSNEHQIRQGSSPKLDEQNKRTDSKLL